MKMQSFFYRKLEVKYMTDLLRSHRPQFTVVLGPPSSGKTALMNYVVHQKDTLGSPIFRPICLNLRSFDIGAPNSLHHSIMHQLKHSDMGWLTSYQRHSGKSLFGISGLLTQLSLDLSTFNFHSRNEQTGVLLIDEANRLNGLSKTVSHDLLSSIVHISKEIQKMHVVFTTSDPFFLQWLDEHMSCTHYDVVVIGDLIEDDAHQFYLTELGEYKRFLGPHFPVHLFEGDFQWFMENVFHLTGGRMYFISQFIKYTILRDQPIHEPLEFPAVSHEYSSLEFKIMKNPHFSRENTMRALKSLVDSGTGYVPYHDVCREIGHNTVSSLIKENILYYRPDSDVACDLSPRPLKPVLTACSQPASRAMDILLND